MTTNYFRTADGGIVTGYDLSQAYKKTDGSVPFKEFSKSWLKERGAVRDDSICTDDLIKAGQVREAVRYFANLTGCSVERAKNAVYAMKAAFGC